jgi:RimJ/RimL family protein N-acetyltransferase
MSEQEKSYIEKNSMTGMFDSPTSAILIAALEQNTGDLWLDNEDKPETAMVFTDSTCYIDGVSIKPNAIKRICEWICDKQKAIYEVVLQNKSLEVFTDESLRQIIPDTKYTYKKTERHLMEIDVNKIDTLKLLKFVNEIPNEYMLKDIDETMYHSAMQDIFLSQFVKEFRDDSDFVKNGFGFILLCSGEIIGGISSYVRYKTGVEVQIAVHPKHRGKHLARSLGAVFLLECQKRKLYPWWDCANPASERIAEQLGYTLKQVNCTYRILERE